MKKDLTLIIPAKNEAISLPVVLKELVKYKLNKIIILDKNDKETINAINNFKCKIIKQKKEGYGAAIIEGIQSSKTRYVCIFNADGSFNPKYIKKMLNKVQKKYDFVFASRYMSRSKSYDDTFLTFLGNKIFSFIGNIFFKIKLSDILYTYILGRRDKFIKLKLKSNDFRLCPEIPIKIKKYGFSYTSINNIERKRIGGKKKVNEIIDGGLILFFMITEYFKVK
jgi:glycosyltransferase involved in cell wall biosynthesis